MVKQSPASFATLRIPISNQRASAGNRIAGISPFALDAWCDYLQYRARLLGRARLARRAPLVPVHPRRAGSGGHAARRTAGGDGAPLLAGVEHARDRQPEPGQPLPLGRQERRRRRHLGGAVAPVLRPVRRSAGEAGGDRAGPSGRQDDLVDDLHRRRRQPRLQRRRAPLRPAHVPALECARRDPGDALRPGADLVHAGRIHSTPSAANGESVLVYPGADGPVASARLEQIRDGIEDWDVLDIVRRKRGAAAVRTILGNAGLFSATARRVELACTIGCELHGSTRFSWPQWSHDASTAQKIEAAHLQALRACLALNRRRAARSTSPAAQPPRTRPRRSRSARASRARGRDASPASRGGRRTAARRSAPGRPRRASPGAPAARRTRSRNARRRGDP